MPRTKKQKETRRPARYSNPTPNGKHISNSKITKLPQHSSSAKQKNTKAKTKQIHIQHNKPIIPFPVHFPTLLLGEGDLSFTASLILDHGCANITATTFDTKEQLLEKYPHASENIKIIEEEGQGLFFGVDATKLGGSVSGKGVRNRGPYRRIVFNFPHTGGVSKDVNRQVRGNQELLAAFFKGAVELLDTSSTEEGEVEEGEDTSSSTLVTLFEGEPYTLWNIRDLARHCGLVVKRSFKFKSEAYPLYKHGRTVGVIKNKNGEVSESAWKGEGRPARTYEFGLKEVEVVGSGMGRGREKATGGNDVALGKRGDGGRGGKKEMKGGESSDGDSD